MSLLDTYFKLQALKQAQERTQMDQIHSILYLIDAMQKMREIEQEEKAYNALAKVSPYTTTEIPQQGMTGNDEYDVLMPGTGEITTGLKPDEQYFRESFEAVKPYGMKFALPMLTALRGAAKEKEAERIRREEDPIVEFTYNGVKRKAALSKIGPLEEKRQARETMAQYNQDKLDETKRHNEVIEAVKQTGVGGGKPPVGFRYTPDGNLEAIPGGPADIKLQSKYASDEGRVRGITDGLAVLKTQAEKLKNHKGLAGITGIRGAIPNIPGTEAANAQALLNQIKSRTSLDVLQNMRMLSPTGGALGNVSDAEGRRLETYIAAIENAQSLPAMQTALDDIIKYAENSSKNIKTTFDRSYSSDVKGKYGAGESGGQAAPTNRFKIIKVK